MHNEPVDIVLMIKANAKLRYKSKNTKIDMASLLLADAATVAISSNLRLKTGRGSIILLYITGMRRGYDVIQILWSEADRVTGDDYICIAMIVIIVHLNRHKQKVQL